MKTIELHCHSTASPDSLVSIDRLEKFLVNRKIDIVAITDHNTIKNAILLKDRFPDRIVVGEEIEVKHAGKIVGEILGYFIQEEIPVGDDVFRVIEDLQAQNAYISLAHPMDQFRSHWSCELLDEIMPMLDGIEVFNSRCAKKRFNADALLLAQKYGKQMLVGSDAHSVWEIGRSFQRIENADTVEDFRKSLATADAVMKKSPIWVHGLSRMAVLHNRFIKP